MKKLTWLSLVLVLAMVLGAISFAFADTTVPVHTNPEIEAAVALLQGVEQANGGDIVARGVAKVLLGDRYDDAVFDLYAAGYYAGASTSWYIFSGFGAAASSAS